MSGEDASPPFRRVVVDEAGTRRLADDLAAIVRPGDLVLTVGAGTITRVGAELVASLEDRA